MEIKEALSLVGLGKRQTSLYLIGLKLGPASILQLSKKTKINRPTLYKTMEELLDQGLFKTVLDKGRKLYVPIEPGELLEYLKRKEAALKKAMPELLALAQIGGDKPKVEYFEGRDQLKTLFWEGATCGAEIVRNFFPSKYMLELFDREELEATVEARIKNHTLSKTLRTTGYEEEFRGSKKQQEQLREIRYVSDDKIIPMGLAIYHDTVAIHAPIKENFGLKITSPSFAKLMTTFFDAMWEQADSA